MCPFVQCLYCLNSLAYLCKLHFDVVVAVKIFQNITSTAYHKRILELYRLMQFHVSGDVTYLKCLPSALTKLFWICISHQTPLPLTREKNPITLRMSGWPSKRCHFSIKRIPCIDVPLAARSKGHRGVCMGDWQTDTIVTWYRWQGSLDVNIGQFKA